MGHPAGIGPEVTLKALSDRRLLSEGVFLVIGDRKVLSEVIATSRLTTRLNPVIPAGRDTRDRVRPGVINLIDLANVPRRSFSFGSAHHSFGKSAIEYIDTAFSLLKAGAGDALVTAPIHKLSAQRSGFRFAGHTEYLAYLSNTKKFAMMLVGGCLRVVLVTRHIPLKDVSRRLTEAVLCDTIELTYRGLRGLFGIQRPRIGIAGLNPHAGEGGMLGTEERIIEKAIRKMRARSSAILSGPRSPDIIFHEAYHKKYDAVVAQYHDQGLIPLKMLYFESGVNLTLGLPFIRTSPDHGTALEIAGKDIADPASMKEAIALAVRLARAPRRC